MNLITIILLVFSLCSCTLNSTSNNSSTIVYLVRHAEKVIEENLDPSLTTDGFARAEDLKEALIDRYTSLAYGQLQKGYQYYKDGKIQKPDLSKISKESLSLESSPIFIIPSAHFFCTSIIFSFMI